MSVMERGALEDSPLADLHTIASELSIDGYRRLRREKLIDAILERQGGSPGEGDIVAPAEEQDEEDEGAGRSRRRRGRRGGRGRGAGAQAEDDQPEEQQAEEPKPRAVKREETKPDSEPAPEDTVVEGEVELLPNGSAFLRVSPPEPSDEDVYISAAQVKRCELISGDRVAGPRRPPRRSERFASLYRIDVVNGRPAAELADGVRFDELPAAFPQQRFALESEDETVRAIAALAPIGRGSRVTIVGPARSGKTETLRRLATTLEHEEGLQTLIVLTGVRPEEIGEWQRRSTTPAQALSLAASPDTQSQAAGGVIDQARRIAARGGHVAVLLDTLDGIPHHAARRMLASARNITDGGSLTLIATAAEPLGGETTVIALDSRGAASGSFPALDPLSSGTIRAEQLVGEDGAAEIVKARQSALRS